MEESNMIQFLLETDGKILLWIQNYMRNDFLTVVFKFITHLCDAGLIWIALTFVFLVIKKTRQSGCLLAVSMILEILVTNLLLKNIVARHRPYETVEGLSRLIEAQKDFSFPSGHSGISFAAATAVFILFPKKAGIPALVFAFLIAFSRLYLGVHFPSDVIVGALAGTVCAVAVCMTYRIKTGNSGLSKTGKTLKAENSPDGAGNGGKTDV